MIFVYQILFQIVKLFQPLLRRIPHEKLSFYFRESGKIQVAKTFSTRPIWIHASSGEIEYAKSVIRHLKNEFPEIPILVTHTSVSSQKAVASLGVEAYGVSPLDTPQDVRSFLIKWQPRICLIARTDLWYQTLFELFNSKIPCFLFSATFAQGSRKTSLAARALMRKCLPLLKGIFFVSQDDLDLCKSIFPHFTGEILGDTRYDQVLYRLRTSSKPDIPAAQRLFLAGSTWPEDEKELIPAFSQLREKGWKFVLVPHEVSESSLASIEKIANAKDLKTHRYSKGCFDWMQTDLLIVDRVGLLAALYPLAHVAFVGGSFRKQVHSVMEALAAPRPVIVGPFHLNNREAIEFKNKGFVFSARNSHEIVDASLRFFEQFETIQEQIQREINQKVGATSRLISRLKDQGLLLKSESSESRTN